jgi:hypothetical protein
MSFPGPNHPNEPFISVEQLQLLLGRYPARAPLLIRYQGPDGPVTFFLKKASLGVNEGDNNDQPAVILE